MLTSDVRPLLKQIARESIQGGFESQRPLVVDVKTLPEALRNQAASFVTLYTAQRQLRGCIGSLEAHRPLAEDVAHNAFAAAFSDPRFPPLVTEEFAGLALTVSVLSTPVPIQYSSEQDLLHQLRPNVDGLILEDIGHRGTFLPAVWESLPSRQEFLRHLKLKAGLPADHWSETLRVFRYTTEIL